MSDEKELLKKRLAELYGKADRGGYFTYTESATVYFGTFRTFGGTESVKDGLYSVIDTATLETWFTPDLKANCRVHLLESDELYEVVGTPEDIQKRHQYLKARLQAIKGGA